MDYQNNQNFGFHQIFIFGRFEIRLPGYKRTSPAHGGVSVKIVVGTGENRRTVKIYNLWVVPYNIKLLRLFECHMNAEMCISKVESIKYLINYIYKGHNRVTVEIVSASGRYDVIAQFLDTRYVPTMKGVWRILKFKYIDQSSPVERLYVDLENPSHGLLPPGWRR